MEEITLDYYTVETDVLETSFYKNGQLHRGYNKPAYEYNRDLLFSGSDEWYIEGKRHRENDLPAIISRDSVQQWFKNDLRHRNGGKPAVIFPNGEQWWCKFGKIHRGGGKPAVIFPDHYYKADLYFEHGREYSFRNGEKYFLPLEELSDFSGCL